MLKTIILDKRAKKEIQKLPPEVQSKIGSKLKVLERDGKLIEPYGKKLNSNLFEIRVKYKGEWRVLYAYLLGTKIVVLSAFHKKTIKTPQEELKKAQLRLKDYYI